MGLFRVGNKGNNPLIPKVVPRLFPKKCLFYPFYTPLLIDIIRGTRGTRYIDKKSEV